MATATPVKKLNLPPICQSAPVDPTIEITDREQLIKHLYQAAYLEMSTIPMYLYASFSIASRGYSQWDPGMGAFRLIRSIVVEEMLHLSLVRNLLVALGDEDIRFYDEEFVPRYPSRMLHRHPELILHLEPCSKELVREVFMEFERPEPKKGEGKPPKGQYATIGEFYRAVGKGLEALDKKMGPALWKHNRLSVQYTGAYWNHDGGGETVLVRDLKSAQNALKTIVEQGEGIDPKKPTVPINPLKPMPGQDELPHYTKFKRIADGIEPLGPIWVMPADPTAALYEHNAAAKSINTLFNAVYCYVLHMLDVMYRTPWDKMQHGKENDRYGLERTFMAAMQGVLVTVADIMVSTDFSPTELHSNVGPTFEFYDFTTEKISKLQQIIGLCEDAMVHFPQLGGDNSVYWLLKKMPDV